MSANSRLGVDVVENLHRVLGGDPVTEDLVLRYLAERWRVGNLFLLPPEVAAAIRRNPAAFLATVREHFAPRLGF